VTALDLPMQADRSGVEHPQIPGDGAYSRDQEVSVETMRSTRRASIMNLVYTLLVLWKHRLSTSPWQPSGSRSCSWRHDNRSFSSISFVAKMLQARSYSQPRQPTRLPSWIARRASFVRAAPPAPSCRH
jgi:hypothetical protein